MDTGVATGILKAVHFLESKEAQELIKKDPYWPKWNSPWWQMQLLFELGQSHRVPKATIDLFCETMNTQYTQFFPFRESDIPAGSSPFLDTPCHCQLGCVYQFLSTCGIDVDRRLNWIRPWFLKYQLPDGGLNCDNEAYLRPIPKSSIVSTLPPLEAILFFTPRGFTSEEVRFLDAGANYLLQHNLYRRVSTGDVIDKNWLLPCFPHFYEYSVLRGLRFLKMWSKKLGRTLPAAVESIEEEQKKLYFNKSDVVLKRRVFDAETTTLVPTEPHCCVKAPASLFPLLEAVSKVNSRSPHLLNWYLNLN